MFLAFTVTENKIVQTKMLRNYFSFSNPKLSKTLEKISCKVLLFLQAKAINKS